MRVWLIGIVMLLGFSGTCMAYWTLDETSWGETYVTDRSGYSVVDDYKRSL